MRQLGWRLVNAVQVVLLALWSVFWISAALVVRLITFRPDIPLAMARTCWAPGALRIAGAKLEVEGGEAIDWNRPHVFLMNHQSAADIPAAFVAIRCPLRFIAKRELAKVPFLGWYMWATGMIFVERDRSAEAVASIRQAGDRIRAGASILAYPEGKRSRTGRIQPFKKGAFVVAIESQVPVVPVAIAGANEVLPADGLRIRPGTIRVKIGRPIPTAGLNRAHRDEILHRVRNEIISLQRSIGGLGGEPSIPPQREPQEAARRSA